MPLHPALSVVAPAGDRIRSGKKILEIRKWSPDSIPLRDLVIVQNKIRLSSDGLMEDPDGEIVAIVDVEAVAEWKENEENEACDSCGEPGWKALEVGPCAPLRSGRPTPRSFEDLCD